jgi:nucleotide-binding universal stress UspA family protein
MSPPPYFELFHPTDFSEPCLEAFYHALAMTVAGKSSLTVFHSGFPSEKYRAERWPRARATLAHWGLLPAGASRDDVAALGITIKKLQTAASDPVDGIFKQAQREECDLLIMATHARSGLARLVHREVATPAMRRLMRPALLFPSAGRRFVDLKTGKLGLSRVLVACAHDPAPEAALLQTARLIATCGQGGGVCREVHVGKTPPLCQRPSIAGWSWESELRQGDPAEAIVEAAQAWQADLIAMVTRGRDHLSDLVLGSTMDRVLAESKCPVLAVPTSSP